MNRDDKLKVTTGIRLISVLLIVGGIVGIVVSVILNIKFLTRSGGGFLSPSFAIGGVFIILFGWSVWAGIDLLRGRQQAITWAIILFAMQIPSLTLPGLSYEFYTGLVFQVLVGRSGLNFAFNFGSSFDFYLSNSVTGFVFGINLAAIAVLIYLVRVRKNTEVAARVGASPTPAL